MTDLDLARRALADAGRLISTQGLAFAMARCVLADLRATGVEVTDERRGLIRDEVSPEKSGDSICLFARSCYTVSVMKNTQLNELVADALACNSDALDAASTKDLVLALGEVADGAPEGDEETLYAMDAILSELDLRSDVDPASRRTFIRWHKGVLAQL